MELLSKIRPLTSSIVARILRNSMLVSLPAFCKLHLSYIESFIISLFSLIYLSFLPSCNASSRVASQRLKTKSEFSWLVDIYAYWNYSHINN